MNYLPDLVRDKTVAVVGNAKSLIETSKSQAANIDAADVVIRMNAGIPPIVPAGKVGSKTTVWATAKHFGSRMNPDCQLMLFMKLTKLGDQHWGDFLNDTHRDYPMERWTQELEDEVKEFVGADPGTGIRIVYFLKHYCQPKKITLYGMDCWKTLSSWSNKPNTPNHVPLLEEQALLRLMSE